MDEWTELGIQLKMGSSGLTISLILPLKVINVRLQLVFF